MLLTARPLDWRRHGGLAGPGRGGRLHSAIRPRRAIQLQAGAKKAAQPIEADLARLYSDPTYQVERDIGPVELRALKGIGRSVHALRDLSTGELLLISQPLGSWLTGAVGEALRPSQLLDHFQHTSRLTPADTYRLALLYDGSETSKARKLSGWKELSAAQASAKASRQAGAAKGFGAAPKPAGAGAAEARTAEEQQLNIISLNAWGEELSDLGVAALTQQPPHSSIGLWPEYAIVNHSCVPNSSCMAINGALFVRAATPIRAGGAVTANYLAANGGLPLARRRQQLQDCYGFECHCPRCTAEAAAPEELRQQLEAAHAWAEGGAHQEAFAAHSSSDAARLQQVFDSGSKVLAPIEQALGAMDCGEEGKSWLRASAYLAYQTFYVARDTLEGFKAPDYGADLATMLQVFAPGSEPHLLLAQEVPSRTAEKHGQDSPETQAAMQAMLTAYLQRYGRIGYDLLSRMVDARSMVPSYMGMIDIDSVGIVLGGGGGGGSAGGGAAAASRQGGEQQPPAQQKATMEQLQALMDS